MLKYQGDIINLATYEQQQYAQSFLRGTSCITNKQCGRNQHAKPVFPIRSLQLLRNTNTVLERVTIEQDSPGTQSGQAAAQ